MKIDSNKLYSVVSGDIISSSNLSKDTRSSLVVIIKNTYKKVQEHYASELPFNIDIYSGDSWQFFCASPKDCFRISLLFRALLKGTSQQEKVDTRISIGIGSVSKINKKRISQSDGEAFKYSGRNLENLPSYLNMVFNSDNKADVKAINTILNLQDFIVSQWTSKQAMSVAGALIKLNQEEIGKLWQPPVSQQAVGKFLKSAGWRRIAESIKFLEGCYR